MTEIDEIKSPFLLRHLEQRGVMDDLVTDLLIVERYLRRPELTDSVAALMLRAAIKNHPLEVEIVSRELRTGRTLAELEIEELKASWALHRSYISRLRHRSVTELRSSSTGALTRHEKLAADQLAFVKFARIQG